MVISVGAVTVEEMVERARALRPRLAERAARTDVAGRVPDETIADLKAAGLFRVLQPLRYGGYELDYGRTQVELCRELGRACGSSAWLQCVLACHAWMVGMFPREAQEAIWGADQDTLISSGFSARGGVGRPVDGGYWLEGEWEFSSGSYACEWLVLVTPIETPDGPGRPIWCVLPRSDWQILDTWHVSGLRATASHNVFVPGAFVPASFTCPANNRVFGDPLPLPGWSVNPGYIYRLPQELFPFNVTTPALGIARGALDAFVAYLAGRPDRASMVQRQQRIAESAAEIDAAEALLLADSLEIERRGRAGGPWSPDFLARVRRDVSYAVVLCIRAVDRLAPAVGAHGLAHDSAFQRAFRDVHAVANHIGGNWDLHSIPYARLLLGLPPQ